jgi:streptomycin 6-kinase
MMKEFEPWLQRWNLTLDGEPIITQTSHLLPVQYNNILCMLKIALVEEERIGGEIMAWWHGQGAAKVFLHDTNAILMKRAIGSRSLVEMARKGQDDEASAIICSVISRLHAVPSKPIPEKITLLSTWFRSLKRIAEKRGDILKEAWLTAEHLLQKPRDLVVLHGDIHHQNILDFGIDGWLAIDPKGLLGERYFDYANIFCNPDAETAIKPGRLEKQARLISAIAGLDYQRLLQWIFAYAGLSAAWHLEDGSNADLALKIAEMSSYLYQIL